MNVQLLLHWNVAIKRENIYFRNIYTYELCDMYLSCILIRSLNMEQEQREREKERLKGGGNPATLDSSKNKGY